MTPAQRDIQSEAIAWHIRLRDGGVEEWESFTRWLEADPARAAAYDSVARADGEITAEAFPPIPANDDWAEDRSGRRARWAGALAAFAALLLLGWLAIPWLSPGADRFEIATAAGQHRIVPLGDGSSIAMNGATRIMLDRKNGRYAELVGGEATFIIRHDPSQPFTVQLAGHQVQDVGTSFNLVRESGRLAVEVIEGSVLFDPGGRAVPLEAGQTLSASGPGPLVIARRDPGSIAGWRRGQLSFSNAPLETVASDLSRSLGANVALDPSLRMLPFTGSIRVGGDRAATVSGLASTLGLEARRTGDGWLIAPRASR